MAIQKPPVVIVQAQFQVLVGRDGPGDLVDGVRRLLERIPGVDAATDLDVRNVQPGLNDVRLDVDARIRVQPDDWEPAEGATTELGDSVDTDALTAQFRRGFGVREVTVRRIVPPDR